MIEYYINLLGFKIRCYFEYSEQLPYFNQEMHVFRTNSDRKMELSLELPKLDKFKSIQHYIHNSNADIRFTSLEPKKDLKPQFNLKGSKQLLNYSKVLNTPTAIISEGLLIHKAIYEFLLNYNLGPHIVYEAEVYKNKLPIDNNFLYLFFIDHGCNQINWEKSIFVNKFYPDYKNLTQNDIIQFNSAEKYQQYIYTRHKGFSPLSLTIYNTYDLFFCFPARSSILISTRLLHDLNKILHSDELSINDKFGLFFEIILDKSSSPN